MASPLSPCLVLAALLSCRGCESCWEPGLPDPPDEHEGDTGPEDTADTEGSPDTAPPPPCDVPETEPNDTLDQADELPQEALACGGFLTEDDSDWLHVAEEDAAWLKFDVDAAVTGSCANVTLVVWDEDLTVSAAVYRSRASTDPSLVFPTFGAGGYLVWLWETDEGSGEDYGWALRASETKAPVTWNVEETEPNDVAADAVPIAEGDQVLAFFDRIGDEDWYLVEVPEAGRTWSFRIEAFGSGSPVNINLYLYGPEILDDPGASPLDRDFKGDDDYDLDANLRYTAVEPTTWWLKVKEHDDLGGPFFWYSLDVTTSEGG